MESPVETAKEVERIETYEELKAYDLGKLNDEETQILQEIEALEEERGRLERGLKAARDRHALLERERLIEEGLGEVGQATGTAITKAKGNAERAGTVVQEMEGKAATQEERLQEARQRLKEATDRKREAYLERIKRRRERTAQEAISALWEAVRLMGELRDLNVLRERNGLGGRSDTDVYYPFVATPYDVLSFFRDRRERGYEAPSMEEVKRALHY